MKELGSADDDFAQAFAELFCRCGRLAQRLLGDRFAAEEIAAEAMARAYAHWPKIRHLPHRDGWVLRVTTNLVIDRTRRRPRDIIALTTSQHDELSTLRITLAAALAELPRRQREVVVLRHLTGLTEAEVAAATGLAVGTVKTHLRRGLDRLRRDLGDANEGTSLVF